MKVDIIGKKSARRNDSVEGFVGCIGKELSMYLQLQQHNGGLLQCAGMAL